VSLSSNFPAPRPDRRVILARRSIALLALACVPLAGCAVQYEERLRPSVPTLVDTLSREQREAVVAALDLAVRRDFAHFAGVPGLDYAALLTGYWREAMAESDRRAFSLSTIAFLAALKNGHTDFQDDWLWMRDGQPLGFSLVWIDGKWVVGGSDVAGLEPGDVIAAIDDEPLEAFFARQRRYLSASSDRAARHLLASRPWLFPRQFTLALEDGRLVDVERGAPQIAPDAADGRTLVRHRWLVADSIAWLRIDCFNDPAYESETLALLRGEYRRAASVVLDLRGNCGGATPNDLLAALADRPFPWWAQYDAMNQGRLPLPWRRNHDELDDLGRPRAQPPGRAHRVKARREFRHRIVLLVDEGCASACEDFVMPLQWIGRATVVGDTTFGSSGQPRLLAFGGGMRARVSTRREFFPDGTEFEGVGIAPDVRVSPTVAALRDGRDEALDAAIAVLRAPARQAATRRDTTSAR
jgi:carboxyl-terminal processing protease